MTREPINTEGHYSTWLWHWVCDRIGCKSVDVTMASKNELPSEAEMQRRGWFVAKVWGDRCPVCVSAGEVPDVEPWVPRTKERPVETTASV